MIKTRFAPSPTGNIHVGNVRIALLNFLFATKNHGHFMLRLDDTDSERSTLEYADNIMADLNWLGINWQSMDRQSARYDRYQWAFAELKQQGRLYPCYETSEELALKRKVLLSQGKPPIYDRAALELSAEEINEKEQQGLVPHWRFKLNHEEISWHDQGRGLTKFHASHLSDPILFRSNGRPIYTISSVLDDIDHRITHVIRGEDHVTNTAAQVQVRQALLQATALRNQSDIITEITYAHFPLLTNADGSALSKRLASLSISEMRESGLFPMAINYAVANAGTSTPLPQCYNMIELRQNFAITNYGKASARFDNKMMEDMNINILRQQKYSDLPIKEEFWRDEFWQAIKHNVNSIADIKTWYALCYGKPKVYSHDNDQHFIATIAREVTKLDWHHQNIWQSVVSIAKSVDSSRKGKKLFMPIRLALTGLENGPELAKLISIIGKEETIARLTQASNNVV